MLSPYNGRTTKVKNEARGDLLVGNMEQQRVTKSPVIKKTQRQPEKVPKSPEFVDTDSDDSDDEKEKEEQPQNVP